MAIDYGTTGAGEPSDLDDITARYHREAPAQPAGVDAPPGFLYIHFKAFLYLQRGPVGYRERDAMHFPPESWSESTLEALASGCTQILAWRGLSPARPLEGLGVKHFYDLLQLFHFQLVRQSASPAPGGTILDGMEMKHIVQEHAVVLYNLVPAPSSVKAPGPPCPHCGAPLRTAKAKQCRACGRSWHDSPA